MENLTKPRIKENYLTQMERNGYVVLENILPNKLWFKEVFDLFDIFIDASNKEDFQELRKTAFDFLADNDNESYYCGVPSSFRNREIRDDKRYKVYLQWCLEFAESELMRKTQIGQKPDTVFLFDKLKTLETICSKIFWKSIDDIGEKYPEYKAKYSKERALPIIFKLVRYNKRKNKFATDPHYDKSGLSIIVDSDDEKVQWKVGKGKDCLLSDMIAPFEYPNNETDLNHCILFPGLCLEEVDVNLEPTPHYVMPVTDRMYRHSLIAFLLVPGLKGTEKLDTQAKYNHDILKEIN